MKRLVSRQFDISDSEELEWVDDGKSSNLLNIQDKILQTATDELQEPKMELISFFDQEGV